MSFTDIENDLGWKEIDIRNDDLAFVIDKVMALCRECRSLQNQLEALKKGCDRKMQA
jgi:hypothetical protein